MNEAVKTTLTNEKGGVGKTTVAIHIAAGLAIQGAKVLLIDGDPQANATEYLGVKKRAGLFNLICQDESEWRDELRRVDPVNWAGDYTAEGELLILPASVANRAIAFSTDNVFRLRERIEELLQLMSLDAIIIDTSPTPDMLHTQFYAVTDWLIYPSEPEFLSIRGLKRTTDRLNDLNPVREARGWGEAQILGIQPTKCETNTNAHDYGLSKIVQAYKNKVWPTMPKRTVWRDCAWELKTIFAYRSKINSDSSEAGLAEAWALVDRFIKKGMRHVV